MQEQWIGKNVDLALLCSCVQDFFSGKGFKIVKDESIEECMLLMIPQNTREMHGRISVKIWGDPNDFMIEFDAGERARSSTMLGALTTAFFGGRFVLRSLKWKEVSEKLQREFWIYVEQTITRLVGSA